MSEDWSEGGFVHQGAYTRQNPAVLQVFPEFFDTHAFDLVIELGADEGGMSMMLQDQCDKMEAEFHAFEIRDVTGIFRNNPLCRMRCIMLHIADVLDEDTYQMIARTIEVSGRSLILCDGGDKVREFCLYSQALKVGDVIMAHDYAVNGQEFEKYRGERWNWFEISEDDIASACATHGLVDFYPEFQRVAWACKIKIK